MCVEGRSKSRSVGSTRDSSENRNAIVRADSAYAGTLVDWAKKQLDTTISTGTDRPGRDGGRCLTNIHLIVGASSSRR
ncbi:hypothetical protein P1P75_21925 [Streptomyces sp. ID05-39B]|uniref:hypothetical protein n=1 Tax=Streptomyces sp. ID05-39B TaxID=3028664 RepID=UPI0029B4650A|nr:hypothetical protein [Streptomyces sp. ID05-39B]MDX3529015.1 hypothetical protein [Streptomyces sp. ID05-39B]